MTIMTKTTLLFLYLGYTLYPGAGTSLLHLALILRNPLSWPRNLLTRIITRIPVYSVSRNAELQISRI